MSAYTTQALIESMIAEPDLTAALDDNNSGTINQDTLNNIIENVSTDIDGALANIYEVPFGSPLPPKVSRAALVFACEAIYQRRLAPNEKNPFTEQAKALREELVKIGAGELNLDLNISRAYPPGVAIVECSQIDMSMR